jgi:hypothetical protein
MRQLPRHFSYPHLLYDKNNGIHQTYKFLAVKQTFTYEPFFRNPATEHIHTSTKIKQSRC